VRAVGASPPFFLLVEILPDGETQSQINDLVDVRDAHRRRKKHLEIQQALTGISVKPEIAIEIENIDSRIIAIESTIARLRQVEVRLIAAIVPNDTVENIADVDLHERLNAIGYYVLNVETAIHKEMGALMRLFDIYGIADEKQRVIRQRRLDIYIGVIIVLLLITIVVLLLK
jgi:hypothetical protein